MKGTRTIDLVLNSLSIPHLQTLYPISGEDDPTDYAECIPHEVREAGFHIEKGNPEVSVINCGDQAGPQGRKRTRTSTRSLIAREIEGVSYERHRQCDEESTRRAEEVIMLRAGVERVRHVG